jgi:hypothetical protein
LGLEYRFEVTALFLGWLALIISGVLLAVVFRRDPLQTRATYHEGEEGERQSHRQETDKHKQRLLPLSRLDALIADADALLVHVSRGRQPVAVYGRLFW